GPGPGSGPETASAPEASPWVLPVGRAPGGGGESVEPVRQAGERDVALVAEPELLHHPLRGPVDRQGPRIDLVEPEPVEPDPQPRAGHLGREAPAEQRRDDRVAQSDHVLLLDPVHLQPAPPHEPTGCLLVKDPEPEAVPLPVLRRLVEPL